MTRIYRQGDVLLVEVNEIPEDTQREAEPILAKGEASGHHHILVTERSTAVAERDAIYAAEGRNQVVSGKLGTLDEEAMLVSTGTGEAAQRYLTLQRATWLVHNEHPSILVQPAIYEVVQQVEYTPAAIQRVVD